MSYPVDPTDFRPSHPPTQIYPMSEPYPGWSPYPVPPPPPQARNKGKKMLLLVILGIVGIGATLTGILAAIAPETQQTSVALYPTYSPLPTYTPFPTDTPVPISTPLLTATPNPRPTPLSTSTPLPTAIPNPTPTLRPGPTFTPLPTATPSPYSVTAPYCDDKSNWNTESNNTSSVQCPGGFLEVQTYSTDKYVQGVSFVYPFAQTFTTTVIVQPGTNTCTGLQVLGNGANSLSGYVCGNGVWDLAWYDSSGHATIVNNGQIGSNPSYQLQMTVERQDVQFYINGSLAASYSVVTSTYHTQVIDLNCIDYPTNANGIAYFHDFSYTPQ